MNGLVREVAILQHNLQYLRKIAGWSAEDLGALIGVTKQTISNLENLKTPLSVTQYIAIRAVLDKRIESDAGRGPILRKILDIIMNCDVSKLPKNKREKFESSLENISKAAASGISDDILMNLVQLLFSEFIESDSSSAGLFTLLNWLNLNNNKKGS